MMRESMALCAVFCLSNAVHAKVVGKTVEYKQGETTFKGYLSHDDAVEGRRPGVLVVPEWWGVNDYARKRADMLAGLGYAAFVADMYGNGIVTDDPKQAGKLAGQVRGTPAFRERAHAALDVLAKDPHVDAAKLGAIGYCFGGSAVLELAYSGADVKAVVSFHGALPIPSAEDLKRIKASILVAGGGADPMVPMKEVDALHAAFAGTSVDYQIVLYSAAKHSFTNPEADKRAMNGVGYNANADRRSWEHMQALFAERLGAEKSKSRKSEKSK